MRPSASKGIPRLVRRITLGPILGIASLAALSLSSACAVENPAFIEDTTGAELGWSCDSGRCTTVHHDFSPAIPTGCGEGTELLVGAGGIAILCAVSREAGADVVHERSCRPLACADALDCPQWEARGYACVEGLCRSELLLDRVDLAALCLFDVPRHGSCAEADGDAEVDRRMALVDAACADGCTHVPAGCLSP